MSDNVFFFSVDGAPILSKTNNFTTLSPDSDTSRDKLNNEIVMGVSIICGLLFLIICFIIMWELKKKINKKRGRALDKFTIPLAKEILITYPDPHVSAV